MALVKLPERLIRPLAVDLKLRGQFQTVRQRVVPRCPNDPVVRAGGNAKIVKREVVLLVQANRRLRSIFFLVKEPEKLAIIFPVPARIVDMRESFVLDLAGDVLERGKNVRRGRILRPECLLSRQTQRTNARKDLQPGQKKPGERGDQTERPSVTHEINREKSGDEDTDRAGLLRERCLVAPQG